VFVSRQANPNREPEAHFAAHCPQDLEGHPESVLDRAAVVVGSLVGQRGQELGDEIAVGGVYLHAIQAGSLGSPGCRGEGPDDMLDHSGSHGSCGDAQRRTRNRRRRPGCRPVQGIELVAAVKELREDSHPLPVDGAGDPTPALDDAVAGGVERRRTDRTVDRGALEDRQADTATGPCFVISDELVGDLASAGVLREVRGPDDTVRNIDAPQCDRREDRVVAHCGLTFGRSEGTRSARDTAVDDECLAGHVAAGVGSEEGKRAVELIVLAEPAERHG
jgi:hypothetical protein